MGHSPQLSDRHGSHVFQSCVVSFKCVLDFEVVSCIIIIIIIALFFQSCVVSFKCVLDLNFVLFCCCCICISSVNAQAGLYDMNFTLLYFTTPTMSMSMRIAKARGVFTAVITTTLFS